jgi:hypothetical protein
MAGLHAMQAVVIVFLSRNVSFPITGNYLSYNIASRSLVPATVTYFHINLVGLIIVFLALSSLAHLIIATVYNKQYNQDLIIGLNRVRWFEYALSASVMMVAIALLVGIYDLSSLIMIFSLVAIMNLLGLLMEVHNQTTRKVSWLSFNVGSLAGIIPWVVVAIYFWTAAHYGGGNIPTFVYWIFVTIFIFFNCFAINMVLQYKKIGPWRDYLFGERAYIVLSLVAKSALAWQVFAGSLRP